MKSFTNASHSLIDGPPALIAQDMSLFDFAIREAKAAAALAQRIADTEAERDEAQAVVEESGEFGAVEEAALAVKAIRDELMLDESALKAKAELKAARKALRAVKAHGVARALTKELKVLRATLDDAQHGVVAALATGRVPSKVEPR